MAKEIVAMILAGGRGSRLYALTQKTAKPAVSFGGKYRIVDFPLSNCVNSNIDTVGIATQYQPQKLNEYIGNGQPWDLDRLYGGVHTLPPYEQAKGTDWYKGTANAIYQKRAYNDDISRPKFALMDPELTKTLPDYQTESGCADIMMHTMERYFTNGGNMELTDALAEGLLRTVMKNAVILHTDPANYEARAEVMWAGSLSHNGLTGCGIACGDFMSHKLEHEMGGMFDVTHGAGLAALWPSWARYVYKDCLPRFVRFARNVMGVTTDGTDEEIALKGIDAMVDFYHSIGMPASFHELGIDPTDAQIDEMARRCLEACGSALGSAKKLDLDDMIAIYHAANH